MSYILAPSALLALFSVLSLPQPARAACQTFINQFGEEECAEGGITVLDSRLIMMGILSLLFGGAAFLIRRHNAKKALAQLIANNGTNPGMTSMYTPGQLEAGAGVKYPDQTYPWTGNGPVYGYGAGTDARGFGAPPQYPTPLFRPPEGPPPPMFVDEKEKFRGVY
ncbi:hypothetical protein HWV62_33099 [Athelia sp. TMB]|nr:hypothetical protein HWV62_33099 [Athelia sp. TMB]